MSRTWDHVPYWVLKKRDQASHIMKWHKYHGPCSYCENGRQKSNRIAKELDKEIKHFGDKEE